MLKIGLLTLLVFLLVFVFLAVGLIRGKYLKGSCGGLNRVQDSDGSYVCESCAPERVKELQQAKL